MTARPDGTVVVTDSSGRSSIRVPTPGTPYAISGGGIMMNNGDGSYTIIGANGQTTRKPYPAVSNQSASSFLTESTIIDGVPNWGIAGGAALALFLLSRRK